MLHTIFQLVLHDYLTTQNLALMKDHIAASFDREIKSSEGCFWEALTDRSSSLVVPGSEYSEDHSALSESSLLFELCSELQKLQI